MMVQRRSRFTKGTKSNVKLILEKLNCFIRKYAYVSKNSNKVARNKTYGNLNMGLLLDPVHTYSEIFANGVFSSVFKKIRVLPTHHFRLSIRNPLINGNTIASLTEHALC